MFKSNIEAITNAATVVIGAMFVATATLAIAMPGQATAATPTHSTTTQTTAQPTR